MELAITVPKALLCKESVNLVHLIISQTPLRSVHHALLVLYAHWMVLYTPLNAQLESILRRVALIAYFAKLVIIVISKARLIKKRMSKDAKLGSYV